MSDAITTTIRMPRDLRAQLDARALVEGRNRTNLILYILRQALAEPEGLVPVRRP